MPEHRKVDTVKVGGKFRVAPAVIEDIEMWNMVFPDLKTEAFDEMSKFGTVVESTFEWEVELANPIDYDPDDQGWRSYPFIVFTAYVVQDNAHA